MRPNARLPVRRPEDVAKGLEVQRFIDIIGHGANLDCGPAGCGEETPAFVIQPNEIKAAFTQRRLLVQCHQDKTGCSLQGEAGFLV